MADHELVSLTMPAADVSGVLSQVADVIESRRGADPSTSYVAKLFSKAPDGVLKKIGEEAVECVMAAKDENKKDIIYETADLWFHSLVMLAQYGLRPEHVLAELQRREGLSGIAEKMARKNYPPPLGEVMQLDDCIFCKIARGEIPCSKVYEDDDVLAFRDIHPKAPVHFLIIPKQHITSLAHVVPEEAALLGKMINLVPVLAKQEGCENGFRTVINTGRDGGQEVPHLHIHVLGGPQPWH